MGLCVGKKGTWCGPKYNLKLRGYACIIHKREWTASSSKKETTSPTLQHKPQGQKVQAKGGLGTGIKAP